MAPLPHAHSSCFKHLVMMIFGLQNGWSPLVVASNEGHLEVVKTLIGAGANVNHTHKVGVFTLLFVL